MGLNNKTNLKTQASTIRNEDKEGLNTAERVGKILEEIVDNTDSSLSSETNARIATDNSLQSQVNDALTKATNNAEPTITLDQLDTLGTDGTIVSMMSFARANKHTRYRVLSGQLNVGCLDVFTDHLTHVLTEVLTSHNVLSSGVINGTHQYETLKIYYRSYNFNAPRLENSKGTWTDWKETTSDILNSLASAQSTADDAKNRVAAIENKLGRVNGIATLDSHGQIPASQLPGFVDDVKEFDGFLNELPLGGLNVQNMSMPEGSTILFVPSTGHFVATNNAVELNQKEYTSNWYGADTFGELVANRGRLPMSDKVYVDRSTNTTYRWSGSALVPIGSDLALGYTDSTAFPGDEGKALSDSLNRLRSDFYDLNFLAFNGFIEDATSVNTQYLYYSRTIKKFIIVQKYFANTDAGPIPTANGSVTYVSIDNGDAIDYSQKIFRYGNCLYKFNGYDLVEYSPDLTDLYNRIYNLSNLNLGTAVVNVNNLIDNANEMSLKSAVEIIAEHDEYAHRDGLIIVFFGDDLKWQAWQFKGNPYDNWELPMGDISSWEKFGGGVGNTYNVTNNHPLPANEFYEEITELMSSHNNPIVAVWEAGVATLGMQITYAISAKTWKTYQYVGANLTKKNFQNYANWIDLAAMSAGSESSININHLCGDNINNAEGTYSLSDAINALLAYQRTSGVTYAKEGLVIYYMTGNRKWAAKQFNGKIVGIDYTEFCNENLWKDFGGSGTEVKTSDAPEEGGKEALSTGGAYEHIPYGIKNNAEEGSSVALLQLVNKEGEGIGDELQLAVGGSGGASQSVLVRIEMKETPVSGAFGSDIIGYASIRSYLSTEPDSTGNGIISRELVDLTTGLTVWKDTSVKPSSPTTSSYTFPIDFTPYFTEAGEKQFRLIVTDDAGNVGRKTINVNAVDVTIVSQKILHYTPQSALTVGGNAKSITMCQFPINATKEIELVTEIFWNGEWKELGRKIVDHTYYESVMIDPCNVLGGGERMTHNAYALRMWGIDRKSGVKGNTIYTTVFCVDENSSVPLVAIGYDDKNDGKVRLYDSVEIKAAAYTPGAQMTNVNIVFDGKVISSRDMAQGSDYSTSQQIQGYASDGSKKILIYAESGSSVSKTIQLTVSGSAIGAFIKDGAAFGFDFAARDNEEADHTIENNGIVLDVRGSSWNITPESDKQESGTGFRKYLGENCLKIAENVTANINYAPFALSSVEDSTGMATQFAFATDNIKDPNARLMECFSDSGAGFYITGNKIVMTCATGAKNKVERPFRCGEKITVAIVVKPSTIFYTRNGVNYSTLELYVNGEWLGCIGYSSKGSILNRSQIKFDGTNGNFYLYYFLQYESYYEWTQAFNNYLCKLTDTDAMIAEYNAENVLNSNNVPTINAMREHGIGYYVIVAAKEVFDDFDSDIDTSKKFECTLYYYHPTMPWRSFKAIHVQWRRQGTTSAKRPIKNDRFYLQKNAGWSVTPLYPEYATDEVLRVDLTEEEKQDIADTFALFTQGLIRVADNSFPVKVITTKVDFSDSSNANDCGVCDMMNDTFRALGSNYMTPIQKAFDATGGVWSKGGVTLSGIPLNHSTANHPVAVFRATSESLADAYFHAKGNWKEDKGEQVALGFKDVPGYNKDCKNYGDFVEFFGMRDETLDEIEARFKTTSGLDTSKLYLLSLYCGRDYRFMKHNGTSWVKQTGSLTWNANGTTKIVGTVLNPVTGYELITYDGLDWWQGVGSIDDMMAPTNEVSSWVSKLNLKLESYPKWTAYFECMVDDDQLQIDLAMGKKVPYELYRVLEFCNSCDYNRAELQKLVNDTMNSGEKIETWKQIWRDEAYKHLSPYSLMAYYVFTDYLAAVDQQAKNMQPMFFLDTNGSCVNGEYASSDERQPIRMYLNKVYDCDTCNGKDNDGGNSISATLDPSNLNDDSYAGRGSVLWNNLRGQQTMKVSLADTLKLGGVVATMRSLPSTDIIGGPFSPQGALEYFVNRRINKWPKKVSSYDGFRKYVESTPRADALYFYALQGSGKTSIPAYIEERWRYRDGCYETGSMTDAKYYMSSRIAAKNGAQIKIKAAKSGYFGVGNDGGKVTKGVYLNAGESYIFGASDFQHGDDVALYIYNADLISEIDLSQVVLDSGWGNILSQMKLAEKIILGGTNHKSWDVPIFTKYGRLNTINLGSLPFLRELDIRNTEATSIDATKCPRLESILATGTAVTKCELSESAPIETLSLPDTLTDVKFVNLKNLTYPGGLTFAGLSKVKNVFLNGCPNINVEKLLVDIADASSSLETVGVRGINATADINILRKIKASGATGYDIKGNAIAETGKCSGLQGRWISSTLVPENELAELQAYFREGPLELFNSQYSCVCFDDVDDDCYNITNLDNGTSKDDFEPSGHFVRIFDNAHAYKTTYDSREAKLLARQISDSNYGMMANGTEYDPTDQAGEGFDIMLGFGLYWYKGVNDFKNQKKYFFACSYQDEPISTATAITRKKLSEILVKEFACIYTNDNGVYLEKGDDYEIVDNANMNVYALDVEGMKQVRFPGINNSLIGAVFVDENDKVVSTFNMAVSHSLFDFTAGEDYIFCDVPAGAKRIIFTSPTNAVTNGLEAIAVDSNAIEAIEPDWVWVPFRFVGVYGMSLDALSRARSISGVKTRTGTGTSTTNVDWKYDSEGNVSNASVPTSAMNYTYCDLMNLCELRGKGFHAISYEISKDIANLVMALTGTRDIQALCGYGCGSQYVTGSNGANAYGKVTRRGSSTGSLGNIIFGIQNFVGCNWEIMDYIACNVISYTSFKKNKKVANASDPIDAVYHVRDPFTLEERTIQGQSTNSGYCVGRVKFGRFCDVIASRLTTDNSKWNKNYSDAQYYTAVRARCVGRSGINASASGGLVCSYADNASSASVTFVGSRLAFSGKYVIVEEASASESE